MAAEPLAYQQQHSPTENDDLTEGARTTVRLLRDSWAVVAPYEDEVVKFFYAVLFSLAPETREMFPVNMQTQRSRLLQALVHVVQMMDQPDELVPFLRQLGRDHRKFDVVAAHYDAVGEALLTALKTYAGPAWTAQVERAWSEAYAVLSTVMTRAAARDPGPAWHAGEVVQHWRLSRDLAVVWVRSDPPVRYEAGQYVSVQVPQRPRLWRSLSPANAPNEAGVLEFHVRAVPGGWVSPAIVGACQPGDRWRIGAPMGRMRVDPQDDRDVLMVAGGTGLAPMYAMLDKLGGAAAPTGRVDLFYGAATATDLYGWDNLRSLAYDHPWLHVTPVIEARENFPDAVCGTLAQAIIQRRAWINRDVFVAGSPAMIRATVSRLLVAGAPLERIRYDSFRVE